MALAPISPLCCITRPQSVSILGLHHHSRKLSLVVSTPEPKFSLVSLNLRSNYALKLRRRKDFPAIYASNTDPPNVEETSNETKDSQGPPFLTIVAGLIVLFIVGWVIWSLVIWLVGIIIHLFPSK